MTNFQLKVKDTVSKWLIEQIDIAIENNPRLSFISKRLKSGVVKLIDQNIDKLKAIEPFITDENGNVDIKSISQELISAFEEMPERDYQISGIDIRVGKGNVSVNFPDSLLSTLFLDHNRLIFTKTDLLNLLNEM